ELLLGQFRLAGSLLPLALDLGQFPLPLLGFLLGLVFGLLGQTAFALRFLLTLAFLGQVHLGLTAFFFLQFLLVGGRRGRGRHDFRLLDRVGLGNEVLWLRLRRGRRILRDRRWQRLRGRRRRRRRNR